MPAMVRETWTDERLDDLAERVDEGFREVATEQRALRGEMHALRTELKAELAKQHGELKGEMGELKGELRSEMSELKGELRSEMSELRTGLAQLNRRFDALLMTLLAGFLALVLAQFFS